VLGPAPYAGLTIADLRRRSYGDGELRFEQTLGVSDAFTRTLVSFDSDGLTVYGFMNTPPGDRPLPVVIVLHGYVEPAIYRTLTYTTRYADALARAGFIVIHPNLRGYPPSDDGPNEFRVGFAVDVLNLIAHIREQAGWPGPLEYANGETIGLWGHSMGGGVSQRVLAVSAHVDGAVLYGAMSGDEQRNHERILIFSGGERGNWTEGAEPSADDLLSISPVNFLTDVSAAVSIHHGQNDEQVPLEWSEELCAKLQELGKAVECFVYDGQPHTFVGSGDALFIERTIDFFRNTLH
jgi:dipeptidyl aminopeptidase/acylaminoacyl peptidase